MKTWSFWIGVVISAVALVLSFRQVELARMAEAFARVDYVLVAVAVVVQLLAVAAIACRWSLFFRMRPRFASLLGALLVAQLANSIIPVRLGMFVRAHLVGRGEGQSRITVFTTVVAEKVFDSLGFVLLFAAVLPLFALEWISWSSLRMSTAIFATLFPPMVLVTYQRQRVLRWVRSILRRVSWSERLGLVQKLEAGLEGVAKLRGGRTLALLWVWTLGIAGLGILVNYLVMQAFAIDVSWMVAVLLLVALQIGNKVLPAAPMGGIGIFQYICTEVLAWFAVDRDLALSFGFVLHFAVFIPGSVLGALALYRMHYSLRSLQSAARRAEADRN